MQGNLCKLVQESTIRWTGSRRLKSDERSPLDFLKALYLNESLPLNVRMRAAIEAAPYLHPKLSATAILANGEDFASLLDRAIERSSKVREVRQIELRAQRVGDNDGG